MVESPADTAFPLREAQELVRDLMAPKPRIYWLDFLFHAGLGWTAFVLALRAPPFSLIHVVAFLVAALALYRAAIFTHELAHLRVGTFDVFRWAWNLVCGIPLLLPSFLYDGVHNEHHKRHVYGTADDGEYVAFALRSPAGIIGYLLLSFLLPLIFVARFLLLAPLSWLIPPLRPFVWERVSSLAIDLQFKRPRDAIRSDRHWRVQEVATFVFAAGVAGAALLGALPARVPVTWYAVATLMFFLNSLRTLAAHAYRNPPDHKLDTAGQFLDSVNVPGHRFLTALWAPVGLRYHATHHLFATLPYHHLGEAHRRLAGRFSARSQYLQTTRTSLWDALRRLWREAAAARRSAPVAP